MSRTAKTSCVLATTEITPGSPRFRSHLSSSELVLSGGVDLKAYELRRHLAQPGSSATAALLPTPPAPPAAAFTPSAVVTLRPQLDSQGRTLSFPPEVPAKPVSCRGPCPSALCLCLSSPCPCLFLCPCPSPAWLLPSPFAAASVESVARVSADCERRRRLGCLAAPSLVSRAELGLRRCCSLGTVEIVSSYFSSGMSTALPLMDG